MMSSGSGFGYNQVQFSSGHATPHGLMLRQKSIGEPQTVFHSFISSCSQHIEHVECYNSSCGDGDVLKSNL